MTSGAKKTQDTSTAHEQLESMGRTAALELYRLLKLTRLIDESLSGLLARGKIGFHIPWNGTEATTVGAVAALTSGDWVFPSHRYGGVALSRGVNAEVLFHHAFGHSEDPSGGRQTPGNFGSAAHNIVSISSSVSARLAQAAGVAQAAVIRGDDTVVLAYLGAAASAANDFHAGLNLAGVLKAPVLYLAERLGTDDAPAGTLEPFGEAYGLDAVTVDGSDVLSVRAAVASARQRIAEGGAPVLIDAVIGGDPISKYRHHLEGIGGLSASLLAEMDDGLAAEAAEAEAAGLKGTPPSDASLLDNVLGNNQPHTETSQS